MTSILELMHRVPLVDTGRKSLHPVERIARNVRVTDAGCWEWVRSLTRDGYAQMTFKVGGYDPVQVSVHRASYELHVGPIANDMQLDHLCRNRACCNPDHLEQVTNRQNGLRSPLSVPGANAAKTQCVNGHDFTPENTRLIAGRHGYPIRRCITCKRTNDRERARRLRLAAIS